MRRVSAAIWALVLVGLAGAVRLLSWYWPGAVFDSIAGGTWTALAWDFAHGQLYRPLLSASGYGGTRYMPLLFMLHGLLIRAHFDPVYTAVMLMQATVLAACLALYFALRAHDVPTALALPLAGTPWATIVYQKYATDIRAEYLAAALAVAAVGAALMATRRRQAYWLWLAAIACVLAGLTKITAVAVAVPIAIGLAHSHARATAIQFACAVGVLFAASLAAIQIASAGQFSGNLLSALTAGMSVSDIWTHGIVSFVQEVVTDPFIVVPLALAAWLTLVAIRQRTWSIAHAYLVGVVAVTIVILASPGTVSNHLVDAQMAATLVVGVALAQGDLSARIAVPAYAALAVVLAALSWPLPGIPSVIATLRNDAPHNRATIVALHHDLIAPGAIYLSTDPMVALLNGERPFVLDGFNLERFAQTDTPVGEDLRERIDALAFGAIVVRYQDVAKDNEFMRLVRSRYDLRAMRPPFAVFEPRGWTPTRLAAARPAWK